MKVAMIAFAASVLAPGPAEGCSFGKVAKEDVERSVDYDLVRADVIAQVEVIPHPTKRDGSAVLKPLIIWRGDIETTYELTEFTSCHRSFGASEVGQVFAIALYASTGGKYGAMTSANQKLYQRILESRLSRIEPRQNLQQGSR